MSTLRCGAEEPIGPNSSLRALNEQTGVSEPALFSGVSLSRYSFVADGADTREAALVEVVQRAAAALDLPPHWLVAWDVTRARSPHRGGTLLARLKNQRWSLAARGALNLASAPLPGSTLGTLAPAASDPVIAGWALIFGHVSPQEWLDEPGFARVLGSLATAQPLEPNLSFLRALEARGLGVAYGARDERGRDGLVIVAPRPLSGELARLQQSGRISSLVSGADAVSVWQS